MIIEKLLNFLQLRPLLLKELGKFGQILREDSRFESFSKAEKITECLQRPPVGPHLGLEPALVLPGVPGIVTFIDKILNP